MWPARWRTLCPLIVLTMPRPGKTAPLPNTGGERSSRISEVKPQAEEASCKCQAVQPRGYYPPRRRQVNPAQITFPQGPNSLALCKETFTAKGRLCEVTSQDPVNASSTRGLMRILSQDGLVSQNGFGREGLCLDLPVSKSRPVSSPPPAAFQTQPTFLRNTFITTQKNGDWWSCHKKKQSINYFLKFNKVITPLCKYSFKIAHHCVLSREIQPKARNKEWIGCVPIILLPFKYGS